MTYDPRFYAALHDGTVGDLAFYRRICSGARAVLELGCGYGRVLAALAGHVPRLVGLDRDKPLLALATSRLADASVELVHADMCAFELGERFDRILIPHSSLLCLLDDQALHACLWQARRHVAPDGLLALDVYDADAFHAEARDEDLAPDELVFVRTIDVEGQTFDVFERSTWTRASQRIDATYVYHPRNDSPPTSGTIAHRYLLEAQLLKALERAGWMPRRIADGFGSDEDVLIVLATPAPHFDISGRSGCTARNS